MPSTLVHRYDFEIDAYDSISYADGLLMNNAYIENGAVVLDGVGAYVDLPNNILIDYMEDASSVSIEAWFIDQGSGNWGRIWDFGNSDAGEGAAGSGTSYAFMGVAGDFIRGAYKLTGQSEQGMNLTPRPSTGVLHQVVWTSDAGANLAVIYVDGVKLGANTAVTATPVDLGATVNDWLGRSQYSGDAYFMGSISEFRVYQGILTPLEVAVDAAAGPDQPQLASGTLTKLAFNMADTIDLLPIEPVCMKAAPVPVEIQEIFWEGACVVAAHQFLTLHGQCGFVDAQGKPNPAYPNVTARIAAFKSLGETVIQRYLNSK